MTEGLLAEDETEPRWEPPVRDLDKFFTSMYEYYNEKGLPTIMLTQICTVATFLFTTLFSVFLIGYVRWDAIIECHDESTCGSLSEYISSNPFREFSFLRSMFVLIYSILLFAFWLWRSYHSLLIIDRAIQMEKFYREKLDITLVDLQTLFWHQVVEKLIQLHSKGIYRVVIKDKFTEHHVVLRIMRKENYMIAFINKGVLDLRVPWWIAPFTSEKLFLTKSLEWSLKVFVLDAMFDDEQFKVSSHFKKDVQGLEWKLFMLGLVHLALLPFMLIFMIITFFLENAQQVCTTLIITRRLYCSPTMISHMIFAV